MALLAAPLPTRARTSPHRRRNAVAVAAALLVHGALLLAILLSRGAPPAAPAQPPSPVELVAPAPPPAVPPKPTHQTHAGGSPATAPKHARAATPVDKPSVTPPQKVKPPEPVPMIPAPAPTLTAPKGPEAASPVTGAGMGAATGGNGPGTGTGPGGPGGLVVEQPHWLDSPDEEVVARFYPQDALRDGRGGSVELSCTEQPDGRVKDCRVVSETPEGRGFGPAALKLSRWFRFVPVREDGRAVPARIRIPYDFETGE